MAQNLDKPPETNAAQQKRQRMRSVAIAAGLLFLAISFYAATIVRLGGSVAERAL